MAGTPPDDPYDDDAYLDEPHESPAALARPSPEVYRRRRIVAALAALILLALLISLVVWIASLFGGGNDSASDPTTSSFSAPATSVASPSPSASATDEASASSSPSASGSESAEPTASPSGTESALAAASESATPQAQECSSPDLSVSGGTDQTSYAADAQPVLELRVENLGEEPCVTNVGTAQQKFTITSGSDRIFSTEDCQVDGTDVNLMLEPGVQETARFTWDRTRSAPGCAEVTATPGAGTYRLEVSLGDKTAQPVAFTLQ